jgi:predicted nucleic acid-binding protein
LEGRCRSFSIWRTWLHEEGLRARREILGAWERWSEVTAADLVRHHAERLVQAHPLRAADALQLAAALVACEDDPAALEFATLDRTQAEAADREGFRVLTR